MMPPEIQARIDQLYADIKPLQEYYGIKSMTIEERYQDCLRRKAVAPPTPSKAFRSKFTLPKL